MKPSNDSSHLPRVGYVGLGIMGRPMAGHLLDAGYALTVFNRTRAKTVSLAAAGARVADSPRAVAEASDIIFTNVTDSPDLEAVVLGETDEPFGVIDGARPGSIVVDNSTVAPATAKKIAAILQAKGVHFLDAPVTGGEKGAVEATLAIMVGGEEPVFQRVLPLLQRLGKTVLHVGPHGAGQMTKAINQILGAVHLCAMAEALALAKAAGLDLEKTRQIVASGAAGSWMLTNIAPRAIAGDFRPGFKVALQNKDLRIALEAATQLDLDLPLTHLAKRQFKQLVDMGCGEEGTQAIVKVAAQSGRVTP